jgi:hypothetical protein
VLQDDAVAVGTDDDAADERAGVVRRATRRLADGIVAPSIGNVVAVGAVVDVPVK